MDEGLVTVLVTAIIGQILTAIGTIKRLDGRVGRLERRLRYHISECAGRFKGPPAH